MTLCHTAADLFSRGRSKRKGRAEYLFTCKVCGQKWQRSGESGYYQVKKKSKGEIKSEVIHIRVTPTVHEEYKRGLWKLVRVK